MDYNFKLESTSGSVVSLKDYVGKYLILYFYPKDNTSGCTIEANEFSINYEKFVKADCQIVGISKDTIKSHLKFKEKESIPYELLSDPERLIHEQFGVLKAAKMYGKDVIKTMRSTFIFDKEGKLIKEFRDIKAKGHAKEVLDFINGISQVF